jgi:hypothetical protein
MARKFLFINELLLDYLVKLFTVPLVLGFDQKRVEKWGNAKKKP